MGCISFFLCKGKYFSETLFKKSENDFLTSFLDCKWQKAQFQRMNIIPLVNNHYENGVSLREQSLFQKYCQSHEAVKCSLGVIDLSKEVLKVSLGQGAAKL